MEFTGRRSDAATECKMIVQNRRIGRFTVPIFVINDDPDVARAAMLGVIVLDARARILHDDIEYFGLCDDFDEVSAGEMTPSYNAVLERAKDGVVRRISWNRSP